MRKHTCTECGLDGYSPDGEVPHEWVDRTITVHVPLHKSSAHRLVVCSSECFSDAVNEYESRGAEVEL